MDKMVRFDRGVSNPRGSQGRPPVGRTGRPIGAVSEANSREIWKMVLPERIELSTSPLPRECSTTELRQRPECGGLLPQRKRKRKACLTDCAKLCLRTWPCHNSHYASRHWSGGTMTGRGKTSGAEEQACGGGGPKAPPAGRPRPHPLRGWRRALPPRRRRRHAARGHRRSDRAGFRQGRPARGLTARKIGGVTTPREGTARRRRNAIS